VRQLFAGIEYPVVAHAALLLAALAGHARAEAGSRRIDGLMALALSYILWFVAIPLWHLLRLHPPWG
jgi:hypothetical protein